MLKLNTLSTSWMLKLTSALVANLHSFVGTLKNFVHFPV